MYINFKTQRGQASRIYEGLLDTKTGKIIARTERRPYKEVRVDIRHKVNSIINTDEDFIILAARKALKEELSK